MIMEGIVGKNIKALRKQKKITLQGLADRIGLTKSYLSKLERSKKTPPYSTVSKIAMALEVEVSYLLSEKLEDFGDVRISLTKRDNGKLVEALGSSFGHTYQSLAHTKPGKNMQPYIIEAAFNEKNIFQHEGEEFIYVLEGKYELIYDGETYTLEEGDSIYFDSGVPHTARSLGKKKAKVLAIMYPYKRLSQA